MKILTKNILKLQSESLYKNGNIKYQFSDNNIYNLDEGLGLYLNTEIINELSYKDLLVECDFYTGSYDMKDVGPSQVNARYHIQYNETNYGVEHYEYFKPVHAGTLYITKSLDNPKGIEFCYIHDESSLMYYTVYLTILNIDSFDIQDYANKIEDYVLLTEKHNK